MKMNIRKIKIPVNEITKAIRSTKAAVKKLDALNAEIAEMGSEADALNRGGAPEVERRARRLDEIQKETTRIKAETYEELITAQEAAENYINGQSMPTGAEAQAPEFLLLTNGLVNTPAELARLTAENQTVTFSRMAEKYANERGWDFKFADNSESAFSFCHHVFDCLGIAVEVPDGLTRMQLIDTPGEYLRIGREYGVDSNDMQVLESVAVEA